jgi:hypothetical protein
LLAATLALGILAGTAAACQYTDKQDYDLGLVLLRSYKGRPQADKLGEAFGTGFSSSLGGIPKDRNFPAICSTTVRDMLNGENARATRTFIIDHIKRE